MSGAGSSVTASDCVFSNCRGDGICLIEGAQARLTNCKLVANFNNGARVSDAVTCAYMQCCSFQENAGVGIVVTDATVYTSDCSYEGQSKATRMTSKASLGTPTRMMIVDLPQGLTDTTS